MRRDFFDLKEGFYIVTGGMGLLGRKHCEAIALYGGTPVILDSNLEGFAGFSTEIEKNFKIKPVSIKTDITKEESVRNALNYLKNNNKPINALINNAARNPGVSNKGLKSSNRLEEFSLNEWQLDLDVSLKGSFLCTKYFGNYMHENGNGVIINISSDLGIIAPNQTLYEDKKLNSESQKVKPVTYSVVKAGIIGLTKYTATYWPKTVRCNCICPGGIKTDQNQIFLEKIQKLIPMQRMANVNEYQGILIFLLSNASSYMTGSIISIDGGRTVW
tara:strand:+ start:1878 stop:2699 length:822 start_codon:yes stop_codon:yes gene_type:complete